MGVILELPVKQHCQFGPFTKIWGKMGWIGSAVSLVAPKRLPEFLFFSIAIDADYSFYVKSIATFTLKFFECIILVLASVKE